MKENKINKNNQKQNRRSLFPFVFRCKSYDLHNCNSVWISNTKAVVGVDVVVVVVVSFHRVTETQRTKIICMEHDNAVRFISSNRLAPVGQNAERISETNFLIDGK